MAGGCHPRSHFQYHDPPDLAFYISSAYASCSTPTTIVLPCKKPLILRMWKWILRPAKLLQNPQYSAPLPQTQSAIESHTPIRSNGSSDQIIFEKVFHAPDSIGTQNTIRLKDEYMFRRCQIFPKPWSGEEIGDRVPAREIYTLCKRPHNNSAASLMSRQGVRGAERPEVLRRCVYYDRPVGT